MSSIIFNGKVFKVLIYISFFVFLFFFDDCVRYVQVMDLDAKQMEDPIIEEENNSVFKTYSFVLDTMIILKRDSVIPETKMDDNIVFMLDNKQELLLFVSHKSWNGVIDNSIRFLKFNMKGDPFYYRKISTSYDFIDVMVRFKNRYIFYEFNGLNAIDVNEFLKNETNNKPLIFGGFKNFKNKKGEDDALERGYIASDNKILYVVVPSQHRVIGFDMALLITNHKGIVISFIEIGDKTKPFLSNINNPELLDKPERIFANNKFIFIPNYRTQSDKLNKIESISVFNSVTKEFIKVIKGFNIDGLGTNQDVKLRGIHNLDNNHTTFSLSISGKNNRKFVFRDRDIRNKDIEYLDNLQEIKGLEYKVFSWGTDNIYVDNITKKLYVNDKDTVKVYRLDYN